MRGSRFRVLFAAGLLTLATWGVLRAQKPFREYAGGEYTDFELPKDYEKKAEWTRARLHYQNSPYWGFGRRGGGSWGTDYPRSDRHLLEGVRRLTRIDSKSVEQIVDLDGDDDIYNWPMLYAVEVGHWGLTDKQAEQLRDYLLRGGFLMVDDFHGTEEWGVFLEGITKVFPDRKIIDLENNDPIFHTIYDLQDRFQVPGWQFYRTGRIYERDGFIPKWGAITDDKGRVMVAICHNMDLGDAWEWSDDPRYEEKWASLAYRIAMNYFTYDLTH